MVNQIKMPVLHMKKSKHKQPRLLNRNLFSVFILLLLTGSSLAQDNKEKAEMNARQALVFEENGKTMEAIPLLEEAVKLDPGNINVAYELAVVYATNKEYSRSKAILLPLLGHKNLYGLVYHLLGNDYDELGLPDSAVLAYEKGLILFPKTAELFLELGNMSLKKKNLIKAIDYFEKGIRANPLFASNYYRAAKLFLSSNETIWGMLYGEIFMNLEKKSDRTAEISNLLYAAYKKHIRIPKDSSPVVRFSNNFFAAGDTLKPSFGKFVYEPLLVKSIDKERSVDYEAVCRIRKRFITHYIQDNYYTRYPNALFSYQYKILKAGHIEAYNHWILSQGDKTGFDEWVKKYPKAWNDFLYWFRHNEIPLSEDYKFYREQY